MTLGRIGYKYRMFLATISLFGIAAFIPASAADAETIGQVATSLRDSLKGVGQLISAGALIAGMGFVIGAIFKFKAHKDNPTQIPVGTPVALLFIGAALLFLPILFGTLGQTLFGVSKVSGSITGFDPFKAN